MLIPWLIIWAIWYFDLRKKKFNPSMAKFYWGLVIMFLPVIGWIAYYSYGKKEHLYKE